MVMESYSARGRRPAVGLFCRLKGRPTASPGNCGSALGYGGEWLRPVRASYAELPMTVIAPTIHAT
jgi:hypothetical protein